MMDDINGVAWLDGYAEASPPLHQQVDLLGRLLGNALRHDAGEAVFAEIEYLRQLCKDPARFAEGLQHLDTLSDESLAWLVRAFTLFFDLINQAESQEIIRKNEERERAETKDHPRNESIFAAVHELKTLNFSKEDALSLLCKMDIQPTLTAHPTETKRQAVLQKQREVSLALDALNQPGVSEIKREELVASLSQWIRLLSYTAPVRRERLTVQDEIHNGIFFVRKTLWSTIPQLYRELRFAFSHYYGESPASFPTMFRYRSWIGGDCDGNPNITASVVRLALQSHHIAALEKTIDALNQLWQALSISQHFMAVSEALRDSIAVDALVVPLDAALVRYYQEEPFRLKLFYMMARLRAKLESARRNEAAPDYAEAYQAREYIADLTLMRDALVIAGLPEVAQGGELSDVLVQAHTFGFYLMALDVRQHSDAHGAAMADILRQAGVCEAYDTLSEDEKMQLLTRELTHPVCHWDVKKTYAPETVRIIDIFRVIHTHLEKGERVIGNYVISMTHAVSDMFEVLWLAKETGSWHCHDGNVSCALQVSPLLEMVDDLQRAESFLTTLFSHPLYNAYLDAQDRFQEIMLGYSDSNKDGGYLMANWMQYNAQSIVAKTCQAHRVDFRLFHGRGGSVGRGGGRANQAIFALPAECCNGRLRVTEQGEVIAFRYSLPKLAHRHLEQVLHAMLITTARREKDSCRSTILGNAHAYALCDMAATTAMKTYRALIDDPDFWLWYIQITPIAFISKLPIASRPVSRKQASEVAFSDLRAIPWVFSWTQCRYNVPGWYGLGTALEHVMQTQPDALSVLQNLFTTSPYFRMVISNAEREMARAELAIAQWYAQFSPMNFHDRIAHDFALAKKHVLAITKQNALLDALPVIQTSIRLRNPYAACLHLLQIDLIKRYRASSESPMLLQVLMTSVNGLAAAMQSTG